MGIFFLSTEIKSGFCVWMQIIDETPGWLLGKNLNYIIDHLSIPHSGGKMSKHVGGIIGCKSSLSPRELRGNLVTF